MNRVKQMTFALRLQERRLIEAALKLANSREKDAYKATQAFTKVLGMWEISFPGPPNPPGRPQKLVSASANPRSSDPSDPRYAGCRQDLRVWFDHIAASVSSRRVVVQIVDAILSGPKAVTVTERLREKRGTYHLEQEIHFNEFIGVLARATALILASGLATRLKQCGNPKCDKFNLDLNPHGRPRTHCNATCKKAADATTGAERARRHREKKAKAKSENVRQQKRRR